jgi:hypothetical protein
MINRLIEIISREAALFESFLDLLQEQKEMLVSNNVAGLNRVTERHQEKLIESRLLSRQREQLIEQIKAANAIDGDLTVTRLLELVDENQAGRLLELKELILSLNDEINRTRNSNAMLLNQSREFIAKTMAALSRINHPHKTYAPAGAARETGGTVAVDRRA